MVDYTFYNDIYKGEISDDREFTKLSRDATDLLRYRTFNRIDNLEDEDLVEKVKITICRLIDTYYAFYNQTDVKSESSGPYSKTYVDNMSYKELHKQQVKVMEVNLSHTGLLSRGWSRHV